MYGHDVANTRTQPDEHGLGPSAAANLTPAWLFSTGSTGDGTQLTTTPVVSDGCVFIGSFGGYVYALDASTGHVVWQRKLDAPEPGIGRRDRRGRRPCIATKSIFLVNEFTAPYAIALDRSTGAVDLEERAVRAAAEQLGGAGRLLHERQPDHRERVRGRRLLAAGGRPAPPAAASR